MSELRCRYCAAAWPTVDMDCEHTERDAEVARQIAAKIHGAEPTEEQIGWFMDDAAWICGYVPDEHPVVTRWNARTWRMTVSGHRFRVEEEDGGLVYVGGPLGGSPDHD